MMQLKVVERLHPTSKSILKLSCLMLGGLRQVPTPGRTEIAVYELSLSNDSALGWGKALATLLRCLRQGTTLLHFKYRVLTLSFR